VAAPKARKDRKVRPDLRVRQASKAPLDPLGQPEPKATQAKPEPKVTQALPEPKAIQAPPVLTGNQAYQVLA